MNDRIKELAREAGLISVEYNGFDRTSLIKAELKFAELIVKECALLCISRPSPGDDVRSREHCREQILEHFRVKE